MPTLSRSSESARRRFAAWKEARASLDAQEQRTRGELNKLRGSLAGPEPPQNIRDYMLAQVDHLSKLSKMVLETPEGWLRNSSRKLQTGFPAS